MATASTSTHHKTGLRLSNEPLRFFQAILYPYGRSKLPWVYVWSQCGRQYDWVRNTTSGETAIVTAVDNLTTLSLTKDIFKGTPATYEIGRGYGWDMTLSITWV